MMATTAKAMVAAVGEEGIEPSASRSQTERSTDELLSAFAEASADKSALSLNVLRLKDSADKSACAVKCRGRDSNPHEVALTRF
jgi:hypothetical protein